MPLPLLPCQSCSHPFVSSNSSTEKKGRPRKTKRGGGAGGGARREARLSPLHESAIAGGQRTAGAGIRPITRGRSASEYIPRSKGKDHLPEIPAMNIKPSDEMRSSSLSGKVASATTPTTPPPSSVPATTTTTTTTTVTATEQQSQSRDKKDQNLTDGPASGGTTGTEEALEASMDFARNVRGTSTPIDVSPDLGNNNRSQTFNGAADVTDTSDRKPPTANGAPDTVDLADSIDTQQIELSLVDDNEGRSNAHSIGGTGVTKTPPSPNAQSWI